jgi:hypothetical protein
MAPSRTQKRGGTGPGLADIYPTRRHPAPTTQHLGHKDAASAHNATSKPSSSGGFSTTSYDANNRTTRPLNPSPFSTLASYYQPRLYCSSAYAPHQI